MTILKSITIFSFFVLLSGLIWIGYEYVTFDKLKTQCAQNIAQEQSIIDITFATDTPTNGINKLINSISTIPGVKNVKLTTSDQALKDFTLRHSKDSSIQQEINKLTTNPLPATATVTYISTQSSIDKITELIRQEAQKQNIAIKKIGNRSPEAQASSEIINEAPFWYYLMSNIIQNEGFYFTKTSLIECTKR